jgi:hypothetical protein
MGGDRESESVRASKQDTKCRTSMATRTVPSRVGAITASAIRPDGPMRDTATVSGNITPAWILASTRARESEDVRQESEGERESERG